MLLQTLFRKLNLSRQAQLRLAIVFAILAFAGLAIIGLSVGGKSAASFNVFVIGLVMFMVFLVMADAVYRMYRSGRNE